MTTLETHPEAAAGARRTGRLKLLAILAVCAAPVIASYAAYYLIRPEGRTNYGELVAPQRNVDALRDSAADGSAKSLASLRGKWVMVTVETGACGRACTERLYAMRQVRLTTGKERDRIERVLLVTGDAAPLPAEYEGTLVLRASPETVARIFPATGETRQSDHIYLVDPLGNLMMRFPKSGDPNRMKKDLAKLLRASRVG